jgi:drug/metabolite transporter (DMT)-like permease
MAPRSTIFLSGVLWAAVAILVWSGSLVMLRYGVSTGLSAQDLTALRFGVGLVALYPFILRRPRGSWPPLPVMGLLAATFGAPYVLLLSETMTTLSATTVGAVNPGIMASMALVIGRFMGTHNLSPMRLAGIGLTSCGILTFIGAAGGLTPGYALLVFTGAMWAIYAAAVQRWSIGALDATIILTVASAIFFLPIYFMKLQGNLPSASASEVLLQALFQGVLVSVVAVYAFTRSVELLGTVIGSSLPALIPVVTLVLEAVILQEVASPALISGAALVTGGLVFVLAKPRSESSKRARVPLPKALAADDEQQNLNQNNNAPRKKLV